MGKGDKKSRKGKIAIGSFGNNRKRKKVKAIAAAPVKTAAKKASKKTK